MVSMCVRAGPGVGCCGDQNLVSAAKIENWSSGQCSLSPHPMTGTWGPEQFSQLEGKTASTAAIQVLQRPSHPPLPSRPPQGPQISPWGASARWAPVWLLFGDCTGDFLMQALGAPLSPPVVTTVDSSLGPSNSRDSMNSWSQLYYWLGPMLSPRLRQPLEIVFSGL